MDNTSNRKRYTSKKKTSSDDRSSTGISIRQQCQHEREYIGTSIRRDGEQLRVEPAIPEVLDDGRRKQGQRGDTDAEQEIGDVVHPEAGLHECVFGVGQIEAVVSIYTLVRGIP